MLNMTRRILHLILAIILIGCLILQTIDIFYDMPLIQHSEIGIITCIIAIFLNLFNVLKS